MSPRRRHDHPKPPPPGIYQLAGTMEGEECWIAYDNDGECSVEKGTGAYQTLEMWLTDHGVDVSGSRPLLFLA